MSVPDVGASGREKLLQPLERRSEPLRRGWEKCQGPCLSGWASVSPRPQSVTGSEHCLQSHLAGQPQEAFQAQRILTEESLNPHGWCPSTASHPAWSGARLPEPSHEGAACRQGGDFCADPQTGGPGRGPWGRSAGRPASATLSVRQCPLITGRTTAHASPGGGHLGSSQVCAFRNKP